MYKIYWGVTGEYGRAIKDFPFVATYYEAGEEEAGVIPREYNGKLENGGIPQFFNKEISLNRTHLVLQKFPPGVANMIDLESVLTWERLKDEKPLAYKESLNLARGDEELAEVEYNYYREMMYLDLMRNLLIKSATNVGYWGAPWFHRPFHELDWLYKYCRAFFPTFYDSLSLAQISSRMHQTRMLAGNNRLVFAVLDIANCTVEDIVHAVKNGRTDVVLWGAAYKPEHPVGEWLEKAKAAQRKLEKA